MKVLVDTSVWSLALRRANASATQAAELRQLIVDHRAVIMGPIRQEILSGVRDEQQFDLLQERLDAFPDVPVSTSDYVLAARFFNQCRAHGIQGSNTDFLICAVAVNHGLAIFTTDRDFARYSKHIPIVLHG